MEEYEKRAREADEAAARARTPEERKAFQEIAALWRKRAAETGGGGGSGKA